MVSISQMSYPAISKEQIPFQLISNDEVLKNAAQQKNRREQLQKAFMQNRLFYSKATIVFQTLGGRKEVSANIWEVTDNHVMLKGGINIPVQCIYDVVIEENQ